MSHDRKSKKKHPGPSFFAKGKRPGLTSRKLVASGIILVLQLTTLRCSCLSYVHQNLARIAIGSNGIIFVIILPVN